MFNKQNYIESLELETNICKHLHTKIAAETLGYRPSEKQRSMLELLQYLTSAFEIPTKCLVENDWSIAGNLSEKSKVVTLDSFCEAMDLQLAAVREIIEPLSESDFNKKTSFPTGQEAILGSALVNFPIKFSAAYRMQLFLYLKANGRNELNTLNCWFGVDGKMN